ncbi:hypothetical protein PENSPDRAFT_749056 [Peniophora sp. CONT]|nr:hypothetical protein PENSPDRAFT_749056 [Peniophora sp. CONT]
MSSDLTKKQLALSIITFLRTSAADGTVKNEDLESLEVATQCIGEAFGVDFSSSEQAAELSIAPETLLSIFDLHLKNRDRLAEHPPSTSNPDAPTPRLGLSQELKVLAEGAMRLGNAAMSSHDYDAAIIHYTRAITRDGTKARYYSNRATAYARKEDYHSVLDDAEQAVRCDPQFVKGWIHLGRAAMKLGDVAKAQEALNVVSALGEMHNSGLQYSPEITEQTPPTIPAPAPTFPAPTFQASTSLGSAIPAPTFPARRPVPMSRTPSASAPGAAGMPDLSPLLDAFLSAMVGGEDGFPDLHSMMGDEAVRPMLQQMAQHSSIQRLMTRLPLMESMERMMESDDGNLTMAAMLPEIFSNMMRA